MLFLQTMLFVALAFALGCFVGCWLKGQFGSAKRTHSGSAGALTREGAARTSTAGELAAPRPHYEPVSTPQPVAAVASATEPVETAGSPEKTAKSAKVAKPAALAKAPKAKAKASSVKAEASKVAATKATSGKEKSPAKPKAAPKAKPAKQKPSAATTPDDLKQIKGVGPQLEAKLNAIGITSFAQISKWTKKDQANFNEQLSFSGRIERDDWVAQAKILAKGGSTEFSKRVAKGEVASSAGRASKRGSKKAD